MSSTVTTTVYKDDGVLLAKLKSEHFDVYEELQWLYHKYNIVGTLAGGFAAYLLGATNDYGDIDFFAIRKNFVADEEFKSRFEEYSNAYIYQEWTNEVYNSKTTKLQIIFLTFNGELPEYVPYVLRNFDIETCKRGLVLGNDGFLYFYIQNGPGSTPPTDFRLEKYRQREIVSNTEALSKMYEHLLIHDDDLHTMYSRYTIHI
ncbi:hypothetical protein QKQ25_gp035 [Hyphantria cunea granulovirus]|uniref:Uncharacterized protein n=1 Tax=Hyphantria cunea granulovirus TaxID=307448 RepID=A0AAF1D266_9BBAC|nr:hypothetical protein QKQ25_gp035 [Hyphantria cunea granulovirus]QBQ01588.1 hypothetical protein HycuGV_00035 [Hyphantria cunea granulovirus]